MVHEPSSDLDENAVRKFIPVVKKEGIEPDQDFHVSVDRQGLAEAVRPNSEHPISQGKTTHEYREDDRLRLNGAPEHEAEIAGPDDLINQRRGTGAKEKKRHESTYHPGDDCPDSPALLAILNLDDHESLALKGCFIEIRTDGWRFIFTSGPGEAAITTTRSGRQCSAPELAHDFSFTLSEQCRHSPALN